MAMSSPPLCCGAFSLTLGVELICVLHLLITVGIVASVSSVEAMHLGNFVLSQEVQVCLAGWAIIGIPAAVGAGVGVLYRIESLLNNYVWYLVVTCAMELCWLLKCILAGSVCTTLSTTDSSSPQSNVPSFTCAFSDTFGLIWTVLGLAVSIYFTHMVYSAKESVRSGYWPELLRYKDSWGAAAMASAYLEKPWTYGSNLPTSIPVSACGKNYGWKPTYASPPSQSAVVMNPRGPLSPRLSTPAVSAPVMLPGTPLMQLPTYGSLPPQVLPRGVAVPIGQPQTFMPSPAWTPVSTGTGPILR